MIPWTLFIACAKPYACLRGLRASLREEMPVLAYAALTRCLAARGFSLRGGYNVHRSISVFDGCLFHSSIIHVEGVGGGNASMHLRGCEAKLFVWKR